MMMRPDNGKIEQVRIAGGGETAVAIAGATIPVHKYEVEGAMRYTVWLDGRGLPVMFSADEDSGTVTFTLQRCDRCSLDVSLLMSK